MARSWYVCVGDKTTGPFTTEQVLEDVKQSRIPADATVCASGLTRFHKIADEPELAAAFAAPKAPTVLPQLGAASACAASPCATGTKCCPMPRVIAASSLLLTGAFWATLAVAATRPYDAIPVTLSAPVGYGLAGLFAVLSLLFATGIVRRKGCASCGASKLHLIGIAGSVILAKMYFPALLAVTGLHVIGIISARKARKQLCQTKAPATAI